MKDSWWTNASAILEAKIARRLEQEADTGVERADEILERVAGTLATVEADYGAGGQEVHNWQSRFHALMSENRFWPSGRILNNCGTARRELASCFVLPVTDDFNEIFDTLQLAALCHRGGGGTGFDFTSIRERGAAISSSDAAGSSGPVSWLQLFNAETHVVMQGGKMRGANLGSLSIRHPDIMEFIEAKSTVGYLTNFNLSVSVDDAFMLALQADETIELVSPSSGLTVGRIRAAEIWQRIAECAHRTGDPGVLFLDTINRSNPLKAHLGPIKTTNPCGEQTLYPYEPSNLGSINLAAFLNPAGMFDWTAFEQTVGEATRLLDNAVDVADYPDPRITRMSRANRRLGLGVMGFADLLSGLGISYDSDAALDLIDRLGSRLREVAWSTSEELAAARGSFPNFEFTGWERPVRNCAITTLAPTGTISMIAGASSGIEPKFAPYWKKDVLTEGGYVHTDPALLQDLTSHLGVTDEQARQLIATTAVAKLPLPDQVRRRHRYAHEVSGEWHVRIAARWQRYIDNAVSKTINLSRDCTPAEVADILTLSWSLGCKGVSVYRQGSRDQDLLESLGASLVPETLPQSRALLTALERS